MWLNYLFVNIVDGVPQDLVEARLVDSSVHNEAKSKYSSLHYQLEETLL